MGEDELMKGKVSLGLSGCFWRQFVALSILLSFLLVPFSSQAGVVRGKVTSIQGNMMELDLGIEKGIQPEDSGRVCYNILIQGKEKAIFIAKFKITHVSDKSSVAKIQEKTAEIKVGHLVEISFKGGELELISDPSGGKVYVDGKEREETPSVVSDVRSGNHVIRIVKQGYEAYEEQVKVAEDERKRISASVVPPPAAKTIPPKAKEAQVTKEIGKGGGDQVSQEKYARAGNELNAVDWFKKGYELRYRYKNNQEAMKAFDKAIEIDPNYADAYALRAAIYNDWGQHQQALRESDQAIKLNPNFGGGFNTRGWAHIGLRNYEKAIEDLNKAIELDPNLAYAYGNRSWAYFMLENYHQSLDDASKAIQINPRLSTAYLWKGSALASLNRLQEAVKNFDKAIELDPMFSWSFLQRGYTFSRLGQTEQALGDFKKAASLGNKDAQDYLKKKGIQW